METKEEVTGLPVSETGKKSHKKTILAVVSLGLLTGLVGIYRLFKARKQPKIK